MNSNRLDEMNTKTMKTYSMANLCLVDHVGADSKF